MAKRKVIVFDPPEVAELLEDAIEKLGYDPEDSVEDLLTVLREEDEPEKEKD